MRGFSTIEVLIALAVLASMLIAASLLAFGTPHVLRSAYRHHDALAHAEAALQREERRSRDSFAGVITSSSTTDGYQVFLAATLLPDGLAKRLTARSFWPGDERASAAEVTSYVVDHGGASDYPCEILPRGDWKAPTAAVRAFVPGDLLPADWPWGAVRIDAVAATPSAIAFGTAATEAANDPSLFLFSIDDGWPRYRSALPLSSTTAAVADIALSSSHAYIASASTCATAGRCGQLKVVDISSLVSPRLRSQLLLPRNAPPYAGSAQPVAAKSVSYREGTVYLGLEQISASGGMEFNVIDVKNAGQPAWRGGFRVGRTVNDIDAWEQRAYAATNARAVADVLALDVSDPANVRELSRRGLPPLQESSRFGYAHVLALYEDELHVGRSYVSNADEWMIVDISDPSLPIRTSENKGTPLDAASVRAIILRESQALVLLPERIEVWARESPFRPALLARVPLRGTAAGAVCVGNDIYIISMEGAIALLTRLIAS